MDLVLKRRRFAVVDFLNSLPRYSNSSCTAKTPPLPNEGDNDLQELKSGTVELNNNNSNCNATEWEKSIIKSIVQDDKSEFMSLSSRLLFDQGRGSTMDRKIVSKLLHLCCALDSVKCATSLVKGQLGTVPLLNETDSSGMSPMHSAAVTQAARCVELLLKKRARTDLKTRDKHGLLPLELSLSSTRFDVIWNPHHDSIEDLVVQIGEKDLTAVKLLCENTKDIDKVAYSSAIAGRVVDLATLLVVAAERVNKVVLTLYDTDSDSKEKTTIYECVIKEALALGPATTSSRAPKRYSISASSPSESMERRKVLLCEIELLQLFGAVAQADYTDRKHVSPLIRACQAGDETVIELLLKTNMDINDVDSDGNSALHWCLKTYKGSCPPEMKIMWLLLKHGARVNQKNKLGLTVLHIAAANGNSQALQVLLLEDPESINAKTEMKETPLFFAVKNDRKGCAELLLQWGASTEVLNLRRQRPIDLAESQDMRFMLNDTYTMRRAFPSQQKHNNKLHGEEVISETCEELLTLTDEGSTTDRTCKSTMTEICKYFQSPGGCFRGTSCLYAHSEEEQPKKQGKEVIESHNASNHERKIFVGGLPSSLDSDSLGNFFEEQFGLVDNATAVGDTRHPRGFGFIIFKHKKSASAAVEAHYVTIMGKQVEIKGAVPKYLLEAEFKKSPRKHEQDQSDQLVPQAQTPGEKTTNERTSWRTASEKTEKEVSNCKTNVEAKSELRSWIDTLVHGKKMPCHNEFQADEDSIPPWLRIFQRWLPRLLQRVSEMDGEYALSSLKADFRATFGLEMDHASLGFPKLSEFMRSFSHLCHIKYVATGQHQTANHMVLLPIPPVPHQQPPQPVGMQSLSSHSTSVDGLGDGGDSNEAKNSPALSSHSTSIDDLGDGVSKVAKTFQDILLGSNGNENLVDSNTDAFCDIIPDEKPEDKSRFLRFLLFLKPDPIFHARPWIHTEYNGSRRDVVDEREWLEGLKAMQLRTRGRHLVLEALAGKKKNSSVFFLREFDFYDNYEASIRQGKCIGCNRLQALWTNFPCMHLLWCSECKLQAMLAASYCEHKCVLCDIKVEKIDLISWRTAFIDQFPPFEPAYIRNLSKKRSP